MSREDFTTEGEYDAFLQGYTQAVIDTAESMRSAEMNGFAEGLAEGAQLRAAAAAARWRARRARRGRPELVRPGGRR